MKRLADSFAKRDLKRQIKILEDRLEKLQRERRPVALKLSPTWRALFYNPEFEEILIEIDEGIRWCEIGIRDLQRTLELIK